MFEELRSLLKSGGRILIVEPRWHVTVKSFEKMLGRAEHAGFKVIDRPEISISRSVVLAHKS